MRPASVDQSEIIQKIYGIFYRELCARSLVKRQLKKGHKRVILGLVTETNFGFNLMSSCWGVNKCFIISLGDISGRYGTKKIEGKYQGYFLDHNLKRVKSYVRYAKITCHCCLIRNFRQNILIRQSFVKDAKRSKNRGLNFLIVTLFNLKLHLPIFFLIPWKINTFILILSTIWLKCIQDKNSNSAASAQDFVLQLFIILKEFIDNLY